MKARMPHMITITEEELKKQIKEKTNEYFDEKFVEMSRSIYGQILATFLVSLNKSKGFGKKRLMQIIEEIKLNELMQNKGVFGKDFSASDNVMYLNDKYGINIYDYINVTVQDVENDRLFDLQKKNVV